jgi:lipopolysaccharide transport system permease protein
MGARLADFEGNSYSYGVYLISGIIFWNLFANSTSRIANILEEKKGLIKKNRLDLVALPIFVLITETVVFLISLGLFLAFLLAIGWMPTWQWIGLLLVYFAVVSFAYLLGLFFAVFSVFVKDLKELLNVVLQVWFWLTPIVYVLNILPPQLLPYLMLNPMFLAVDSAHNIVLYQKMPDLSTVSYLIMMTLFLITIMVFVTKKIEKDIRDFL